MLYKPLHIHYLNLNLKLMPEKETKISNKDNQTFSMAGRMGGALFQGFDPLRTEQWPMAGTVIISNVITFNKLL